MPHDIGSRKPRAALAAMAASTAVPPFRSTSTPICTARGCAAATMPWRAYTMDRVAKLRPAGRSEDAPDAATITIARTAARRRGMKPPLSSILDLVAGGHPVELLEVQGRSPPHCPAAGPVRQPRPGVRSRLPRTGHEPHDAHAPDARPPAARASRA